MATTSQRLLVVGIQKKRGEYQKLSPEDKAAIGKYASEHGITRTEEIQGKNLKQSSVRDWQNLYIRELQVKRKKARIGEAVCVDALPIQKHGNLPF